MGATWWLVPLELGGGALEVGGAVASAAACWPLRWCAGVGDPGSGRKVSGNAVVRCCRSTSTAGPRGGGHGGTGVGSRGGAIRWAAGADACEYRSGRLAQVEAGDGARGWAP